MHRRLGIVFAIFMDFASAQAAVAPGVNTLAECRLEYSVAQGEMKKLKVIKQVDDSDSFSDDVKTEYDPAKLRPFGLKATRFVFEDYADEGGESHTFETDFALSYDATKAKLFKAFDIKQCAGLTATTTQACRLFLKKSDGGKHSLLAELRQLTTGGSRFSCVYLD